MFFDPKNCVIGALRTLPRFCLRFAFAALQNGKMARPTKAIKRSKQYTVRLTLVESKWIEREARRHGLSISDYMRRRSLTHRLKPRLSEEEQNHYRKLVGMANNLNQLTRAVHNNEALSSQIIKTLEGVNSALEKLR